MLFTDRKFKFFTLLKEVLVNPFGINNRIADSRLGAWNI